MEVSIISNKWEEEKNFDKILQENEKTILYFYPKDNTSGCSIEAGDFSKYKSNINKKWIWIIWVSKDSCKSHSNFIEKKNLSIDLISDANLVLHKKFDVIWEKKMYWKTYQWVIRSTFLLDKKWNILKERRNVKAKWHVEKVLDELEIGI